jgi:hypothetical protein
MLIPALTHFCFCSLRLSSASLMANVSSASSSSPSSSTTSRPDGSSRSWVQGCVRNMVCCWTYSCMFLMAPAWTTDAGTHWQVDQSDWVGDCQKLANIQLQAKPSPGVSISPDGHAFA